MRNLYVAAGQNDKVEKEYVTKENYRKVKNVISHPDFDQASYFKDLLKFTKANAKKSSILELKCYFKDYINKLIADKRIEKNLTEQLFDDLENDPIEFLRKIQEKTNILRGKMDKSFLENVRKKLFEIRSDILDRVNFTKDNDIALVELEQPFEFGKGILPSCLLENNKKQFDNSLIRKSI